MRSLTWTAATSLVVGACFNPSGQNPGATTGPATDPGGATEPTSAGDSDATVAPTSSGTTIEPTTDAATQASDGDTGPCPACAAPTAYCAAGGCIGCQDLPAHGLLCADFDAAKPQCDPGGECVACVVDDHCDAPLHCDPAQKTCVTCVDDVHCGDPLSCVDGQCVGCTGDEQCPAIQPICDPASQTCRSCRAHDECPGSACELDVGTCFPPLATRDWYVDPGVPCADDDKCVVADECCSVEQAMARAAADPAAYHILHVKPGVQTRPVRLAVPGKRVALLGVPDVVFTVPKAGAVFGVGDDVGLQHLDSKLYVSRLYVTEGQATTVAGCVEAGHLWLDEVGVFDVPGEVLSADHCLLTVRRSSFRATGAGITSGAGGVVHLENSIVGETMTGAPLQSTGGGQLDLLYTTVVDKGAGGIGLLNCQDPATVTIRNSILAGVGGEIQCPDAELKIADTVTTADGLGGANITELGVDDLASIFADYAGSSYHLGPGAALLDHSAVWQPSDPPIDIDGEGRPMTAGAPDFAGADRP
ncbi:hypothetical protein OV090_11665 [Nannocystis sp. RBIL2]|uniref:hypothetical protein n=1 Tax=Nannocystis sp. RBIL2 TaxID=2996788 RepID=UPI00226F9BEF|nr:hypothetical protein [Nannocystis sp. RBIL2]MCY1065425.1 hypothetical protein [Nannocystis sp. RBIL2]